MAVQTTATVDYSILDRYIEVYGQEVFRGWLYDQLATDYDKYGNPLMDMKTMMRAATVNLQFQGEMEPEEDTISETADVTPQTIGDATVQVTPTSRRGALLWSEKFEMQVFDDWTAKAYEKIAKNAVEVIDNVALNAATQGTMVKRAAARASLDAGTAGNRASDSIFAEAQTIFMSMKSVPFMDKALGATYACILHPRAFHDIREGGNVNDIGLYQDASIHLNWEMGKIGNFRLLPTPYAKVFWTAGADNTTDVDTTLSSAATALAKTIVTTDDVSANISVGDLWLVGTEETTSTNYPKNEVIHVTSASTYTLTFEGEGPNGGLRFDHPATTTTVRNADHVYPMVFGGPRSLIRLYASDVGAQGEVLPPETQGILKQWNVLAWKWYGQYARLVEKDLLRWEVTSSFDA